MSSEPAQKNDIFFWNQRRGKIFAQKGGWIIGEAVYNQGYSMLDDLVGKTSFFQVLLLNTVGRIVERRFADWLESLFICLSWPDSRIWCNQTASLAGVLHTSPVAAVCAGILASDSKMYGPGCMPAACDFIRGVKAQIDSGSTLQNIIDFHSTRHQNGIPVIAGYARPIATGDERIPAMERVANNLALEKGKHLSLAYELEEIMQSRWGESMNLAGYSAAFFADYGFTPQEVYRLLSCWVHSGVLACYAEAADQPPESFFPLQCGDIDYQGQPPRSVPDDQ
ncbi:MAG: hypothetical protein ACOY32_00660 [Thermodesulfobacteriota bacterium]